MKKILLFLLLSIAGYGQIIPSGGEQDFDYGIRNTASQLDDNAAFITVQDATGVQGKSTSSVWAKKIYVDNADATKSFLSTGLIKNGLVTTNADPTKFNITAGIGIITNFDNPEIPTSTIVSFPAFTDIVSPYLNTSNITYVAITLSGGVPVVLMQATAFDNVQRRNVIALGAVIHSNLTTINLVNNISAPTNAGTNQLHDLYEFIGALNLTGNKYTANGANLSLDKTAGTIGKLGVNFANNWRDPNRLSIGLQTLLTFRYRTQNGTESGDFTVLNPAVYDLANVLTAVPSNKFSIQTVTLFQTGMTRIQYGQNVYNTLAEAEAAILTRSYVVENNIAMNGIARAYIILKNTATSLQNASDTKIVEAQKFGGVASGGVALTDSAIIAALGYTPANDADVVHKIGNETVLGTKTFSPNVSSEAASAKGTNFLPTLTATANNDIMSGIFISPIFNVGTFTGVSNSHIRLLGASGTNNIYSNLTVKLNSSLSIDGQVFTSAVFTNLIGSNGANIVMKGSGNISYASMSQSTGNFIFQNGGTFSDNGIDRLQVNGSILGTALKLSTTPTTSAGTYDMLTRNTSTGVVEKVLSNTIATVASPSFTGTVSLPTSVLIGNISNSPPTSDVGTYDILTRKSVTGAIEKVSSSSFAPLDSPSFTGTPTAPTATVGTNTTQIATTAFVQSANGTFVSDAITDGVATIAPSQNVVFDALALKANLTGASFTGNVNVNNSTVVLGNSNVLFGTGDTGLITSSTPTFLFKFPTNIWQSNVTIKASTLRTDGYTVSTLPTGTQGDMAFVTDALAPTYMTTVVGGGAVVTPVFYNGTNWVAH